MMFFLSFQDKVCENRINDFVNSKRMHINEEMIKQNSMAYFMLNDLYIPETIIAIVLTVSIINPKFKRPINSPPNAYLIKFPKPRFRVIILYAAFI